MSGGIQGGNGKANLEFRQRDAIARKPAVLAQVVFHEGR